LKRDECGMPEKNGLGTITAKWFRGLDANRKKTKGGKAIGALPFYYVMERFTAWVRRWGM